MFEKLLNWIKPKKEQAQIEQPKPRLFDGVREELKQSKTLDELITKAALHVLPSFKLRDEYNEFVYDGVVISPKGEHTHKYVNKKTGLVFLFSQEFMKQHQLFERTVIKESKSSEPTLV